MNTHATEELLDVLLSMQSVLYQRKIGDLFFPELLVNTYKKRQTALVIINYIKNSILHFSLKIDSTVYTDKIIEDSECGF
jgi:hypothetical protein